MISKERRAHLRACWESEIRIGDEWRTGLTDEEADMVALWDRIRQDDLDRVTRAYWQERRREA